MRLDDPEILSRLKQMIPPLLDWFARNARVLPWRNHPTPYQVWISEIMLQQTRVEAVKEYYLRFISELPDIQALANVSDDRLMKLWEGLGYYNRARNLKKTAILIMEQHNGIFPDHFQTLLTLPGIGEYTAGSISSIAFGLPEPAVDGNVLRVLSRLLASREDIALPPVRKTMTSLLRSVYPKANCGALTESLMELGAMVCVPNGTPKCEQCPIHSLCIASQDNLTAEIPCKSGKTARVTEDYTVLLMTCGDRIAIRPRPKEGLLAGLWEFPNFPGKLDRKELRQKLNALGITEMSIHKSISANHIFTHREWHMSSYLVRLQMQAPGFLWLTKEEIRTEYSIPSAFKAFQKAWFET